CETLDLSSLPALTEIRESVFRTELEYSRLTEIIFNNPKLTTIGSNAFFAHRCETLDLSSLPALTNINNSAFSSGSLENSRLTEIIFNNPGLYYIHPGAFNYAPLLKGLIDLSASTSLYGIGDGAFRHSSLIDGIIIGGIHQYNTYGNLYNQGPPTSTSGRIVAANDKLPVWILGNARNVTSASGYVINPIDIVVNFVDNNTGVTLVPSRRFDRVSLPLANFPVTASSIYGYKLVSASPAYVNDSRPVVPGVVETYEVTFYYEPLTPEELVKFAGIILKQDDPRPHGYIGTDLHTTVNLSNSDVTGDNYDLPPGSIIEIYYDPTRIDKDSIRVSIADDYYDIDTTQEGKVVLTLHNGFAVGEDIEASIIWRLIPGPTEEYVKFPLYAQVRIPDSVAPDGWTVAAQANVVSLSGYYNRPGITKYANGEYLDYGVINLGSTDPEEAFLDESDKSITYTYRLYGLERNLSEIILTDYLPEYLAIDEHGDLVTTIAHFDPAKNPGWTLIEPGVVSYTLSVNNTTVFNLPQLILDFPRIYSAQMVKNGVSFVATPHHKADTETVFDGRDTIINLITQTQTEKAEGMFSKTSLRPSFFDFYDERARSFRWRIDVAGVERVTDEQSGEEKTVVLPQGQYLTNVVIEDHSLDVRMRYVGVEVDVFGPARVTAYDSGGTILFDAQNQRGFVTFPLAIRNDIDRVVISESKYKITGGQVAQAYITTELRDPNLGIEENLTDPVAPRDIGLRFPNYADISVDCFGENNNFMNTVYGQVHAETIVKPFEAGLGISKSIIRTRIDDIFLAGDPLSYGLNLDLYNAFQLVQGAGDTPDDRIVVRDVVIYDVLPKDFVPSGTSPFVPSNGLLYYSTDLKWSILSNGFEDADGWHDVLKIEAATMMPFKIFAATWTANLGRVNGYISELAYDHEPIINHVYLDFTEDAFVYRGPTSDLNPYLDYDDNPFGDEVLWSHARFDVIASQALAMQKQIRITDPEIEGGYGFWSNKGIMTPAGSEFQYRLRVRNNTEEIMPRTSMVLVDVFPYVGDVGVARTDQQRFSQFENTLDGSGVFSVYIDGVKLMGGYTISFLLNPLPSDYPTYNNTQVLAYLDNPLIWSSSYSDASQVKGFRLDLGSIIINPGSEVEVIVDMIANSDLSNVGSRAFNSFVRKDNIQTTYIEAPKVYNEIPDKPAEIRLRKREGTSGTTYLDGAVFGLYRDDGSGIGQLVQVQMTTSSVTPGFGDILSGGGWLLFSGIERGNYYIQEITPPAGYEPNSTRYLVYYDDFKDPDPKNNMTPFICNKYSSNAVTGLPVYEDFPVDPIGAGTPIPNTLIPYYGSLKLRKTDGSGSGIFDGAPMQGLRFTLRQVASPNTSFNANTGTDGIIRFDNLLIEGQYRDYTVTEVAAPGRLTVVPPFTVRIHRDGTVTLQSVPSGAVGLIQFSGSGNTLQLDIANVRASVRVRKIGVDEVSSITDPRPTSGVGLGNVELELYKINSDETTTTVRTLTTGTSGTELGWLTFTDLEVGQRYGIHEVTPPSGYLPYGGDYFFSVDETGVVRGADGIPYWNDTIVVLNEREEKLGSLIISKVDANDPTKKLAGAVFTVERWIDNSEGGGAWVFYTELTSDNNGFAQKTEIPFGAYRVVEIQAPEGYVKQPQMTPFFIDRFQETIRSFTFLNTELDLRMIKGTFVQTFNPLIPSDVIAMAQALDHLHNELGLPVHEVVNADGTVSLVVGLASATFEMKEYEGVPESGVLPIANWILESDEDGILKVVDGSKPLVIIDTNVYTFKEIDAPEGYTRSTETYTWRPDGEAARLIAAGGIKWLAFNNTPLTHSIAISKHDDASGKTLAGAVFKLFYPDGTSVFFSGSEETTYTTDGAGRIDIAGLNAGTYYLQEVEAPDGYLIPEGYWKIIVEGKSPIVVGGEDHSENLIETEDNIIDEITGSRHIFIRLNNIPQRRFQFPPTGGPGLLMSVIVGCLFIAGAAVTSRLSKGKGITTLMLLMMVGALVLVS
ncbi:MAG: SpaA isopeptide-forming pilin-related protein, partial [Coriobacteriia bacterium]|nr:SpaA isopeptide-forming pilin-related protein [Coriobacteriia bacterium]